MWLESAVVRFRKMFVWVVSEMFFPAHRRQFESVTDMSLLPPTPPAYRVPATGSKGTRRVFQEGSKMLILTPPPSVILQLFLLELRTRHELTRPVLLWSGRYLQRVWRVPVEPSRWDPKMLLFAKCNFAVLFGNQKRFRGIPQRTWRISAAAPCLDGSHSEFGECLQRV